MTETNVESPDPQERWFKSKQKIPSTGNLEGFLEFSLKDDINLHLTSG